MSLLEAMNNVREDERYMNNGFVQFSNELNNVLVELGINPLVYIALKRHENNKDKKCFPSYGLMVKETGLCKATVIKHIKLLEQYELIKKKKKHGKNYYTLVDFEELKRKELDTKNIEQVDTKGTTDDNRKRNGDDVPIVKENEEFLARIFTYNEKNFKAQDWQKVLNEKDAIDFYFTLNNEEKRLFDQIYKR